MPALRGGSTASEIYMNLSEWQWDNITGNNEIHAEEVIRWGIVVS